MAAHISLGYGSIKHVGKGTSEIAHGNTKRAGKRSMLLVMVGAVILIGTLGHIWGGTASADAKNAKYVVQPGDTVWSIARKLDKVGDPRQIVDQIEGLNHMEDDVIYPGQAIMVPQTH